MITSDKAFAQEAIEALQAALLAHYQGNPLRLSYSIGGKAMQFRDIKDVEDSLSRWQSVLKSAEAAERLAVGIPPAGRLMARF